MSDTATGNRRIPLFRLRVDRPERILDAALDLFTSHGYQKGRVEDVARLVGVTKPAIYHHFASKQVLLEEVVARYCLPSEPPPAGTPQEMLRQGLSDPKAAKVLELVIAEVRPVPSLGPFYIEAIFRRLAKWPQFLDGDGGQVVADVVGRAALEILFGAFRVGGATE